MSLTVSSGRTFFVFHCHVLLHVLLSVALLPRGMLYRPMCDAAPWEGLSPTVSWQSGYRIGCFARELQMFSHWTHRCLSLDKIHRGKDYIFFYFSAARRSTSSSCIDGKYFHRGPELWIPSIGLQSRVVYDYLPGLSRRNRILTMHASELQWLYPYHVFFKSFQGKSNEASLALFSKIHWSIRWWHLFLYYSSETHLTLRSIAWSGNLKAFKYDSLNDQGISIAGWHTYTKPCVFLLCRNTRVSVLPNVLGPTYNSPGELSTMWWDVKARAAAAANSSWSLRPHCTSCRSMEDGRSVMRDYQCPQSSHQYLIN